MTASSKTVAAISLLWICGFCACATRDAARRLPRPSTLRATPAPAPGFIAATAHVRSVSGRAWVSNLGEEWNPLHRGDLLKAGAVVWVEHGSRADFFLGNNGPALRAVSDTLFAIRALSLKQGNEGPVIDVEFFVERGRLIGHVADLPPGSRFQISTPAGEAKVR